MYVYNSGILQYLDNYFIEKKLARSDNVPMIYYDAAAAADKTVEVRVQRNDGITLAQSQVNILL